MTCRNHGLGSTGPGHPLCLLCLLLPASLVSPLAAASPLIPRLVNMRSDFPGFVLLLGALLRPCALLPTVLPTSLTPKAPDSLSHGLSFLFCEMGSETSLSPTQWAQHCSDLISRDEKRSCHALTRCCCALAALDTRCGAPCPAPSTAHIHLSACS